jgi:hypothetical protein
MTTIKQIPVGVLRALGLHKGDFLTVRDETPTAFVVEITTAAQAPSESGNDVRRSALERFAAGAAPSQAACDQELDDARFEYLRAKHLK